MSARIARSMLAALLLAGCSGDDAGPVGSGNTCVATGNGSPPVITLVSWTHAPGCSPGTPGLVSIDISVSDPDTDAADLTFEGSVTSCSGAIDSANNAITCPQAGQYVGQVRVTDLEGNCDRTAFAFDPCQDGQVAP